MLKTVTPGEALSILYSAFGARRTEAEACPLALARGRVLAEDVEAAEFVPGFDRSSVDGYALAAADTFGCGEASPALLRLAGRVEMGRAPDFALSPGECAEIPTGGRLPEGADAVVMLEHAEDYGSGLVGILKGAAPGAGVVFRGDDPSKGNFRGSIPTSEGFPQFTTSAYWIDENGEQVWYDFKTTYDEETKTYTLYYEAYSKGLQNRVVTYTVDE